MPFTVKFQTGQSVNFDKQPTPQDIEEVSNKLGINQVSSLENSQSSSLTDSLLEETGNIVNSIFPGEQVGKAIGTLGGYGLTALKEGLGLVPRGTTEAYNLLAPSPLQVTGDIAKGAALVGGLKIPLPTATSILGKIGQAAVQGAKIGGLAGTGQSAINTSGASIPTNEDIVNVAKGGIAGSAGGAVGGALVSGFSSLLEGAGNKIINSVIKPSQADIKDGFSIDIIKKYNLGGSLPKILDKTEAKMNSLTQELNQKLENSNATINLQDVFQATAKKLEGNKLTSFGANTSTGKALEQLQGEVNAVGGKTPISIPDAQIVKRAAGHFGAWQYGAFDPESTARETIYNTFYRELKTFIEKNSPEGVKEINKQLSDLIPVANAVIRRIPVAARNNILSLGDIIALTGSAINPHALGISLLSLASKSGTAGNFLTQYAHPALEKLAPSVGGILGLGASALTSSGQSTPNQEKR